MNFHLGESEHGQHSQRGQVEIETLDQSVDIEALEAAFVEVEASYIEAKGISYASWRDVGVGPDVQTRRHQSKRLAPVVPVAAPQS